jgi:hypothetical protein
MPKETRELVEKLLLTNLIAFYEMDEVRPKSIVEEHYIYLVDEKRAVLTRYSVIILPEGNTND